ncbi:retinol dehydrogenase 7-like [Dermacentor variabilis]|uniref:retinol dehydrogenase 7-like n=1 Tax=Dermacentor variabilis TaxID=34621 RepID=UPI003F5C3581
MRTSWTLFFAFLFLLWSLWDHLTPLQEISAKIGSVWVALWISYKLSGLLSTAFVREVCGEGKAVLITGCDTGFGHRLAKRLSRKGFLVFAGCLSSKSDGAKELKLLPNINVMQLDVTDQKQIDDALDAVKEQLDSRVLWSVVANAGIGTGGYLEWLTTDTVAKVFDVNVLGTLRVIKKFLPLLKNSQGRVVTLASPLGHFTVPMVAPYCMTKHAVVSMMDAFRRECSAKSVDMVTVEPSAYKTSLVSMYSVPKERVMLELRKQAPEVIADYSDAEIGDALRIVDGFTKLLIRDDPEECVDILERAIRETHPKTHYQSPLGLDRLYPLLISSLPSEAADLIISITTKLQRKMLLWSPPSKSSTLNGH